MSNNDNPEFECLRTADLIAKLAGVNLKSVVRVLEATDDVAKFLAVDPGTLLLGNRTDYANAEQAIACHKAFKEIQDDYLGFAVRG